MNRFLVCIDIFILKIDLKNNFIEPTEKLIMT